MTFKGVLFVPAELYWENIKLGDEMPVLTKEPITELQLVKYAGASGDFNPIHTVDAIGKKAGLGGVIAHGMLVMGFMGQAITNWVPNKYLKKFKTRFVAVTKPQDIITVSGKVIKKEEDLITCEIMAKDQKGEIKTTGQFEFTLPKKS